LGHDGGDVRGGLVAGETRCLAVVGAAYGFVVVAGTYGWDATGAAVTVVTLATATVEVVSYVADSRVSVVRVVLAGALSSLVPLVSFGPHAAVNATSNPAATTTKRRFMMPPYTARRAGAHPTVQRPHRVGPNVHGGGSTFDFLDRGEDLAATTLHAPDPFAVLRAVVPLGRSRDVYSGPYLEVSKRRRHSVTKVGSRVTKHLNPCSSSA
jgi:hypothetical protein